MSNLNSSTIVRSQRPIPFRRIGPLDRVEVEGVPLECRICHHPLLSLTLLERLEQVLLCRVERGEVKASYAFAELAAEL